MSIASVRVLQDEKTGVRLKLARSDQVYRLGLKPSLLGLDQVADLRNGFARCQEFQSDSDVPREAGQ